jgi:hypothetical protein
MVLIDPTAIPAAERGGTRTTGVIGKPFLGADAAQGGWALDALLFAIAAIFAGATVSNQLLSHRTWAFVALWSYAAATLISIAALIIRSAGKALYHLREFIARTTLTIVTFAGVALLPTVLLTLYSTGGRIEMAQPEIFVIESSARRILNSATPYLSSGNIAALPETARLNAYMPYFPGMALFGMPYAIVGSLWWSDARIWFAATFITTTLAALWLLRPRENNANDRMLLRAAQAVTVLPTCALTMATGGDDLPVLGFCLLALALCANGRFGAAGHRELRRLRV